MSSADTADQAPAFDNPLTPFGVGDLGREGLVGTLVGQLGPRLADHRGRIDLPVFAVLFDHVGGFPFFLAQEDGASTLQSRLSMSLLADVAVTERLTGRAEVRTDDGTYGVSTVDLRTAAGRLCVTGTARSVRVGRGGEDTDMDSLAAPSAAGEGCLPEPIDPELSGRDIVDAIAAGALDPGPIVRLLDGRIEEGRFVVRTAPWMGNHFGTMHGGLIATIVAQGISLAAQAHTAPGVDYRVADLSVGFYRSPAVDGGEVIVEVEPVKVGRRIGSFDAVLRTRDGLLLSKAVADVIFR
ncbi:PaaI family thioesterase [Gordonia pseudamarae]|jgi:uncharacterized protein (TIGR00369 family)|uniref:PaaI family thioesterase n=1 Tax=Gordonia pseudamarae TaxID=2831662 RepID=A0ABX6IKT2_9ACTN|nr:MULTISPECIES: PaaI family thioesterase [Gordonia]MBD0021152.1 PaaI family thioesterase [Gordonia sp. (in: high G+C Gram-positive bacteria)]QHN27522.1 PaaI family thioesterase [Gordonia pseudamarae]QHN36405.1 PaaI family thioesterase [Gordonia pseudamarae]